MVSVYIDSKVLYLLSAINRPSSSTFDIPKEWVLELPEQFRRARYEQPPHPALRQQDDAVEPRARAIYDQALVQRHRL